MTSINISIPDALKDWIESQISAGNYADIDDYVRDVIRRDQNRNEALLDALDEGLASGVVTYSMDDIWARATERAESENAKRGQG